MPGQETCPDTVSICSITTTYHNNLQRAAQSLLSPLPPHVLNEIQLLPQAALRRAAPLEPAQPVSLRPGVSANPARCPLGGTRGLGIKPPDALYLLPRLGPACHLGSPTIPVCLGPSQF